MQKLKLDLVIRKPDVQLGTGVRVFDSLSLNAADHLVRTGGLGRHGKTQYYVVGSFEYEDGHVVAVDLPLYKQKSFEEEQGHRNHPSFWAVNPAIWTFVLSI
jgi:hypothetical protein